MILVIFPGNYPYGVGEEFLEQEMKIAEYYFQEIIIVSHKKPPFVETKYVPRNAKIIKLNENWTKGEKIRALLSVVNSSNLFELMSGIKERGLRNISKIARAIIVRKMYHFRVISLKHHWAEKQDNVVFYSYWFGDYFFSKEHRNVGNNVFLSRAHGGDCFFDRGYIPFRKQILEDIDGVYPISIAGKKDILNHYGKEINDLEKKIATRYLGVIIKEGNACCEKRGNTSINKIISCSSIIPLKRLDLIIDALSICNSNIEWIHFGSGDQVIDIEEYAKRKLKDKKNITYSFKGYVNNQSLLDYYKNNYIDLFLNCSDVEGIPVSIMEAMSFGIPVIARDVGGNRELVSDNTGKLVDKKDGAETIAKAIDEILSLSHEEIISIRKHAYMKINRDFNAVNNYHNFYEEIKTRFND